MPVWCPKCHAMLPDGLEACPKCGTRLGNSEEEGEIGRSDIFWMSAYSIGIVLIPVVVILIIGVLCILLFMLR
jgi:hypothetical protein